MPTRRSVALQQLYFDPANPRLLNDFGNDQDGIFRFLITDIGVDDLLLSMSASGMIEGDPIIVKDRPEGGHYVIEGNRRLAALKLLTGQRPNDDLPNPTVPEVSPEIAATFGTVSVQEGWPEELLQAYLGYKHVTATREWPPEAKAKFVFDHAAGDLSTDNLRKFARRLGTKFPTLRRWLVAYLTLRQAERNGIFEPANAPTKGYFGTFYTLLGGEEAQKFLGLQKDPLTENPVPESHLRELGQFVKWTIGSKQQAASVNSRQQKSFEQILASPKALEHFRVKGDLEASLLYTEYNASEIAAKFREAAYMIEDCLTKLFDVREEPTVRNAFIELDGAFRKARLNMGADQGSKDE